MVDRFTARRRATWLAFALVAAAVSLVACAQRSIATNGVVPQAVAANRGAAQRSAASATKSTMSKIVFFGDSITYGEGSDDDKCQPQTLGSDCYADVTTFKAGTAHAWIGQAREVNMGVVGSCLVPTQTPRSVCEKIVSGAARIPRFARACRSATYAIIFFGANDALDNEVTLPAYQADLTEAIERCHAAGVPRRRIIVSQTIFRPRVTNAYLQLRVHQLDALEAQVVKTTGSTLAYTYAPMARCGKPCYFDWVHPNGRGHELLAKAFLRAIASTP